MSYLGLALQNRIGQQPGLKKSKLAIPKVNPDPQPPNADKTNNKGQDNQSKKNQGQKGGVKANPASGDFSSRGPSSTVGDAPQKPTFAPPTDPRDSQYWSDLIKLQQKRDFDLQQKDLEQTYSNTAFQEALGNLARQEPRDILSTQENANRAGALYSSKTSENIGQLEQSYFQNRSDLTRSKAQEDQLRALAKKAIEQGYTADEAALLIAAADRAAQAEQDRPVPTDTSGPGSDIAALLRQYGVGEVTSKNKKDNKKNKPKGGKGK